MPVAYRVRLLALRPTLSGGLPFSGVEGFRLERPFLDLPSHL